MSFVSGYTVLAQYFEKWRSIAFAFAATGVGVAPLILAPLQQHLIFEYGWRGAMLISSGILLNGCALGGIMTDNQCSKGKDTISGRELFKLACDRSIFSDLRFYLVFFMNFLHGFGNSPVLVLFCDHMGMQGYTAEEVAWLFSIWGISNVIGRPLAGLLTRVHVFQRCSIHLFYVADILSGVFALLIGLPGQQHLYYVIMICGYGLFYGATFGNWGNIIIDIFGQDKLPDIMGFVLIAMGSSYFIGAPVGGMMFAFQLITL